VLTPSPTESTHPAFSCPSVNGIRHGIIPATKSLHQMQIGVARTGTPDLDHDLTRLPSWVERMASQRRCVELLANQD
jgi:hypothetical protein